MGQGKACHDKFLLAAIGHNESFSLLAIFFFLFLPYSYVFSFSFSSNFSITYVNAFLSSGFVNALEG